MTDLALPDSFASVIDLGEPIRVYRQGRVSRWLDVVVCAGCLALALGLGYYGLVAYPRSHPGVASENGPFIFTAACVILLGSLYWAWRIRTRWGETAVLYRQGLAHLYGSELRKLRWSEVESLSAQVVEYRSYGVIKTGTKRKYTIRGQMGGQIKLDETLAKVEDLFDEIRRETLPHILARSKQAFDAGATLQFGPIAISRADGVQRGKKRYAWDEIAQIRVANGQVGVKPKRGGPFGGISVAVASIPNVDAFLAIAADMAQQYLSGS